MASATQAGLNAEECNVIKAVFSGAEFQTTETGDVWASIEGRGAIFRERGDVVWSGDECDVLKVAPSLEVVLEAVRL